MTNEQTLIHLRGLRARIVQAIEATEKLMPEDAPKEQYHRHHTDALGMPLLCFICSPSKNPAHWYVAREGFQALTPLDELLESIDEDIQLLAAATAQSAKAS